jgi:hypothetical protein
MVIMKSLIYALMAIVLSLMLYDVLQAHETDTFKHSVNGVSDIVGMTMCRTKVIVYKQKIDGGDIKCTLVIFSHGLMHTAPSKVTIDEYGQPDCTCQPITGS